MKKFWLVPVFCLIGIIAYLVASHHLKSDEIPAISSVEELPKTSPAVAPGTRLIGRVGRVVDGDTLEFLADDRPIPIRVRISDIDAPEKDQPFGQQSRQALAQTVDGNPVAVVVKGYDRYGRTLGLVFAKVCKPACIFVDVNAEQVKTGMAWAYRFHNKASSPEMLELETKARKKNIGLWSDPDAVEPWKWRHQMKGDNKTTQH
ncbi:thermonuclease family protein [Tatumella sp. UCD-D_suzukii]|uniref:thermonuclease family protein n=1 Tax=Tatumella sp. UCD-D_suzukii TaxID=1408192 RepID=UPI000470F56D|nr:thermonuclease family protein [Tatumella sp. UCD-D_suzukii]